MPFAARMGGLSLVNRRERCRPANGKGSLA